jgi:hypothetical protein
MWFGWIIDIGGPGPDRGQGGKYLFLPPDYEGPVPEGGFYVGRSKTNHALYVARAFMVDNDPKPSVALIQASRVNWLPPRDSNPDMLLQRQLSYH